MIFKVRCIDDRVSNRKKHGFVLAKDQEYEVVAIRMEWGTRLKNPNLEFAVSEAPDIFFFARRFKPVGKIVINLPDDIENIWV